MIDIQEKKNKILEFLKSSGPSLPVQVARAIQMDPVFASAILSELLGSRAIKTSYMKIGSSPLYLIPGQEEKLEEKTENLKSIEKEAQEKLKLKKVITDEDEQPAIRVALRNIKDFATPFKLEGKIMWKYAFIPQEEIDKILSKEESPSQNSKPEEEAETTEEKEVPKSWEVKEEIKKTKETSKKVENIFEKKKEKPTPGSFLEEVENFLEDRKISITAIEEVDKKKVVAKIKSEDSTSMLFAFNKLRINETELLKCYKTADKKNLSYQVIIKGDLTKKLSETISAHQKLLNVYKLKK